MGKKVTLGGDRLGSGNKNKQELHNYYRSTHDLSQTWTSPMTVGALYPFIVLPAMRNDKFEINLNADCLTVPTKGPLFGSFKFQLDIFQCPIRLYQAILHNNPTNIGLKMNQVLLPTYELEKQWNKDSSTIPAPLNNSCLWKYLGLSGIGSGGTISGDYRKIKRAINAVPLLAYYDIFKNYYSNKQEEKAYVIEKKSVTKQVLYKQYNINGVKSGWFDATIQDYYQIANSEARIAIVGENLKKIDTDDIPIMAFPFTYEGNETKFIIYDEVLKDLINFGKILHDDDEGHVQCELTLEEITDNVIIFKFKSPVSLYSIDIYGNRETKILEGNTFTEYENLQLSAFNLKNIDDMRMDILSHHTLGTPFKVSSKNYLPYSVNTYEKAENPLNGLVVKTYQSDLFNNWINTEWIDGENGIAEITKIATNDGAFKIDQLNLAEKLYNMLNRVAVSGGTYEDWQDAVYDQAPHKHIESPIYLGGLSSEIVFEQIVANTAAETANGEQPLGDLAGRGRYIKRKGGHITVKCDEASFLIGIASITPRVKYCQGNEFYLTELKTLDDMHKPALDGIGFQNLLGERLAWWDTKVNNEGTITSRSVIGKVPAWIEYMTAVDKTFGDFAEQDGKAFMSLNRNYEADETDGTIADATTYIDPTKYNYAFAVSKLESQNFWAEIQSKITARRKMSAKQIPNI